MMDTGAHAKPIATGRMVYVEPRGGSNPETVVRVVWEDLRPEERQIFETLEEALIYARSLCETEE